MKNRTKEMNELIYREWNAKMMRRLRPVRREVIREHFETTGGHQRIHRTDQVDMHRIVVHILHDLGGGTQTYVNHLRQLFPYYRHIEVGDASFASCLMPFSRIHVHCFHVNQFTPSLFLASIRPETEVVATFHDFSLLFPMDPNMIKKKRTLFLRRQGRSQTHQAVFEGARRFLARCRYLIFPSQSHARNFHEILPLTEYMDRIRVVPHCDFRINYHRLTLPSSSSKTLHVGFIGHFHPRKGSKEFLQLTTMLETFQEYRVQFHVLHSSTEWLPPKPLIFHSDTTEVVPLFQRIAEIPLSLLCFLPTFEETYCYTLSLAIHTGLPLLALKLGSFPERLAGRPHVFLVEPDQLISSVCKALSFVIQTQTLPPPQPLEDPSKEMRILPHSVLPPTPLSDPLFPYAESDWYALHYFPISSS